MTPHTLHLPEWLYYVIVIYLLLKVIKVAMPLYKSFLRYLIKIKIKNRALNMGETTPVLYDDVDYLSKDELKLRSRQRNCNGAHLPSDQEVLKIQQQHKLERKQFNHNGLEAYIWRKHNG